MPQCQLIMYTVDDKTFYCLDSHWEKEKSRLHGRVEYMRFPLRSKSPTEIARKIRECMSGAACPSGGGHICLK